MIGTVMETIRDILWSVPLLCILLGTHLYFTIRLKFIQRKLPKGIRLSLTGKGNEGNNSAFSALATALAATIGTGNIIGMSAAIVMGGPGAVLWCWITGILGMATCYAECFLSARYKIKRADGTYTGGPMYVMERVLHQKNAAILFSVAAVFVSLGMGGSVQAHAAAAAVTEQLPVSRVWIGAVTAVIVGSVILGGAGKIIKVCTWLVPVMGIFYMGSCFFLIWKNREILPETIGLIFRAAFSSGAVRGGIGGAAVTVAIRTGISRGLFTNEAGLGSIPISAAASQISKPEEQGLVSMTGPFWDTVIMCAVTGIALVGSMLAEPQAYKNVSAEQLCFIAFDQLPAGGRTVLSIALVLFTFATMIGWCYYGECAMSYLWDAPEGRCVYRIVYIGMIVAGAVLSMEVVWALADIFNVWMMIPNIVCLWLLRDRIH